MKDRSKPGVIWITGLSGSGKSTLAQEVTRTLRGLMSSVVLLDGDDLREVLQYNAISKASYTREERLSLAIRYSRLTKLIADQGYIVVVATISMFHEVYVWNRDNLPGYFEIYLKVPIDELRRRDPKNLYRDFEAGKLQNVAGLDLQVDEPERPDWSPNFQADAKPEDLAADILRQFKERYGI